MDSTILKFISKELALAWYVFNLLLGISDNLKNKCKFVKKYFQLVFCEATSTQLAPFFVYTQFVPPQVQFLNLQFREIQNASIRIVYTSICTLGIDFCNFLKLKMSFSLKFFFWSWAETGRSAVWQNIFSINCAQRVPFPHQNQRRTG